MKGYPDWVHAEVAMKLNKTDISGPLLSRICTILRENGIDSKQKLPVFLSKKNNDLGPNSIKALRKIL